MQPREKKLIIGVVTALAVWLGSGLLNSVIFEPLQTRRDDLDRLRKAVSDKNDKKLLLARAKKSLKDTQAISLPPDPGKSKQPTALNAQRLYLEWLTDLAELCGFEDMKVTAGNSAPKGKVYVSVGVKLECNAHYEQLVRFLDLFYRTSLAHRISTFSVSTKVFEGDPLLTVRMDAEGLVMLDAPARRTLFPQTMLAEPVSEDGKLVQVLETTDFPTEPGFRVLLRREFLTVTAMHDDLWTVERGVEQTQPAASSEGATLELVKMLPGQGERTLDQVRELVSADIFMKPSPPYKLVLPTIAEKTVIRGKSLDFTIPTRGYDSTKGKPEFSLIETDLPNLKLEKFGKVSWKPTSDDEAGHYPVKFEIRHASIAKGTLEGTFSVWLRDPNPAPVLAKDTPPPVYLNREWTYRPPLVKSEKPTPRFTWRLGDKAPAGLKINDRSGELSWLPGDDIPTGETTVNFVATDSDSPPQSTTLSLKLNVQDDAAQFTRLTGIFAIGNKKRLLLFDPSTDKHIELHEGDDFSISDVTGKIKEISKKYAVMTFGQQDVRWDLGQSLREAQSNNKDY